MAHFKSVVTNYGAQVLGEILATGGTLNLTAAAAGRGRPSGSPAEITGLVDPVDVDVSMGEMEYTEGSGVARIPIQISNGALIDSVPIREVAIFATHNGDDFIFGYSWLDGEDGDNVLAPSRSSDYADTIHVQDVGLFVTNQEAAAIIVQVGDGTYISRAELYSYASPKGHAHSAAEITESTGENVEVAQRRQDYNIAAMMEQLDTGFAGTTLMHTFSADEMDDWMGYEGVGLPEGVYDEATATLYA